MTKLALIALTMFTLNAHAAPTIVAKITTAGGMPGPNPRICMSSEINVYSDGSVTTSACDKDEKASFILPAKAAIELANIAQHPSQGGTLVVVDPSLPECNDVPTTNVDLITPKGPKTIGQTLNCREVVLRWQDRVYHFEASALHLLKGVQEIVQFAP